MIHDVNAHVLKSNYPSTMFELDNGQLLKEQAEFENNKSTDNTPRTIAHYVSPQSNDVAFESKIVAEQMKLFGMDVIPVCGDELAMMEGIEEDLGLILEHVSEINSAKFDALVKDMKVCLHLLGWNYDGWVDEGVDVVRKVQ